MDLGVLLDRNYDKLEQPECKQAVLDYVAKTDSVANMNLVLQAHTLEITYRK